MAQGVQKGLPLSTAHTAAEARPIKGRVDPIAESLARLGRGMVGYEAPHLLLCADRLRLTRAGVHHRRGKCALVDLDPGKPLVENLAHGVKV